jgi:hypothetical protein
MTVQDIKEEFNKDLEILRKVKILEMKNSIIQIQTLLNDSPVDCIRLK